LGGEGRRISLKSFLATQQVPGQPEIYETLSQKKKKKGMLVTLQQSEHRDRRITVGKVNQIYITKLFSKSKRNNIAG